MRSEAATGRRLKTVRYAVCSGTASTWVRVPRQLPGWQARGNSIRARNAQVKRVLYDVEI